MADQDRDTQQPNAAATVKPDGELSDGSLERVSGGTLGGGYYESPENKEGGCTTTGSRLG